MARLRLAFPRQADAARELVRCHLLRHASNQAGGLEPGGGLHHGIERIHGRDHEQFHGLSFFLGHLDHVAEQLLFVVGEERDSLGAQTANEYAARADGFSCRFLVNGEPTENRIALASKGTLRVEVTAKGRMAHSAYPELGDSAIDKLIPALTRLRAMPLPADREVGACTLNIGLIEGGRAPNVIPDYAHADLLYRLVGPSEELRRHIVAAAGDHVEVTFPLELPFLRLRTVDGLPTMIAAFTTDIPKLTNWGEPLLIGPGSIHVAHTDGEYIEKKQLADAIDLYCRIAKELLG